MEIILKYVFRKIASGFLESGKVLEMGRSSLMCQVKV